MAGRLISGNDPPHGGGDADVHLADRSADLFGQGAAEPLGPVGVLEDQVLLQEDA